MDGFSIIINNSLEVKRDKRNVWVFMVVWVVVVVVVGFVVGVVGRGISFVVVRS